jgi:rod shape-determining protein MreB
VDVSSVELRDAIAQPVSELIEVVKLALEETPPDLLADIMQNAITLAGGGALLKGLDKRLSMETRMHVYIADDPLTCVVRGAGRIVEALEQYDRILRSSAQNRRAVVVQ